MKTKTLAAAVSLALLAAAQAGAAWMDNNWKYRKNIFITSSSAITNAQVLITNAIGSFESLVKNGQLKSDYRDLRFTTDDGTTLIPYWIAADNSGVYIKVPAVGIGKTLVYMYHGNLQASTTSSFANTMRPQADATTAGLWYLDDGPGTTYPVDYSVYQDSGIIKDWNHNFYAGASWLSGGCNKIGASTLSQSSGYALSLTGSGEYMYISTNSALNAMKSLSVSLWLMPGKSSGNQSIIRKDDYNNSWKMMLSYSETASLEFFAKGDRATEGRISISKLSTGQWSHVVATYDFPSSTLKMYLNGVLENTVTKSDIGADVATYLLLGTQDVNERLTASIAELVIYNRAISKDEVTALYNRRTYTSANVASSEPTEISKIVSDSRIIRPGTQMTYTFVFGSEMDTTVVPTAYVVLPSGDRVTLTGTWVDAYTCTATYAVAATAVEGTGEISLSGAKTKAGVSIGDCHSVITIASAALLPNDKLEFFPNPFSPNGDGFADKTSLFLKLDAPADVRVTIFDLKGTVVRNLFKGTVNGNYTVEWDGKDNSGDIAKIGLYIYQVKAGGKLTSGSVVLTK